MYILRGNNPRFIYLKPASGSYGRGGSACLMPSYIYSMLPLNDAEEFRLPAISDVLIRFLGSMARIPKIGTDTDMSVGRSREPVGSRRQVP